MSELPGYFRYWGKASKSNDGTVGDYHLLVYHLLDVAAVAWVLLERDKRLCERLAKLAGMSPELFRIWFTFLMGLHDVGKFSPSFQHYRSDIVEGRNAATPLNEEMVKTGSGENARHDTLGYLWWEECWEPLLRSIEEIEPEFGALFSEICDANDETSVPVVEFASPVFGHHGKPPTKETRSGGTILFKYAFPSFVQSDIADYVKDWCALLFEVAALPDDVKVSKALASCSWALAGMATLVDWIGSGKEFGLVEEPLTLENYWHNRALVIAESALNTVGFTRRNLDCEPITLPDFFGFDAFSGLQKWAADFPTQSEPMLVILEDQTGAGKTEAALVAASRIATANNSNGYFFALPTQATSNAMFNRVAKLVPRLFTGDSKRHLILAHGAAEHNPAFAEIRQNSKVLTNDEAAEQLLIPTSLETTNSNSKDGDILLECNAWFADNKKKAFLVDVGVGTIDQVLVAGMRIRHQSLRLLGLGGKVLIVDEVHANDEYMRSILSGVLMFQGAMGGSAVLLSATLPSFMKNDLTSAFQRGVSMYKGTKYAKSKGEDPAEPAQVPYPLATLCTGDKVELHPVAPAHAQARTVQVQFVHDKKAIIDRIVESVNAGLAVAWIRNTVVDALESYSELASRIGEESLTLFHSRFVIGHRLETEEKVLNAFGRESSYRHDNIAFNRAGRVVIGTQVLEQSLDVDFDVLFTDLAPIDVLIQRQGRLRRHRRGLNGATQKGPDSDVRGDIILTVLAPEFTDKPDSNWYGSMFPKAKWVYESTTVLYRTLQILRERGGMNLPSEAREMIEFVFQEGAEIEAFSKNEVENEGRKSMERSEAMKVRVNPQRSYSKDPEEWQDLEHFNSRLAQVSRQLYLGYRKESTIEPVFSIDKPQSETERWRRSQMSVPASFCKGLDTLFYEGEASDQMTKAGVEPADILVLRQTGDSVFEARLDVGDKKTVVVYSKDKGLLKRQGTDDE